MKQVSKNIKVVPYQTEYKTNFRLLNEEWIGTYFKMEEADFQTLNNPEECILKKGGHILVAPF